VGDTNNACTSHAARPRAVLATLHAGLASKRVAASTTVTDTLRHDSLISLQVGPETASQTEAQTRYQAGSDILMGQLLWVTDKHESSQFT
jgi:hypothetical protein